MRVTLSLNFNPDSDSVAVVTVKHRTETIMVITLDFCAGASQNEHQIITQVVQEGGLAHYAQAQLILAASQLIDSIFTGQNAISTIDL
jgi:hypothetical protein